MIILRYRMWIFSVVSPITNSYLNSVTRCHEPSRRLPEPELHMRLSKACQASVVTLPSIRYSALDVTHRIQRHRLIQMDAIGDVYYDSSSCWFYLLPPNHLLMFLHIVASPYPFRQLIPKRVCRTTCGIRWE